MQKQRGPERHYPELGKMRPFTVFLPEPVIQFEIGRAHV